MFRGRARSLLGIPNLAQALYGERGLWVRPAAMWQELLERDGVLRPRFEYLGPWEEDGEQPDSPRAEAQA